MRSDLKRALGGQVSPESAHPGLVYERYVPFAYAKAGDKEPDIGEVGTDDRAQLLRDVCKLPVSPAYRAAYRRWRAALQQSGTVTGVVETSGRLLIGHGNPAPTEVGLTLHHVYGVPLLPGSALKGLLNHYLATWGPAVEPEWRGVGYDKDNGRPIAAPGNLHGAMFGVPNLPLADGGEQAGRRGGLVFEDAWMLPGDDFPLCTDVLTPHQGAYYRKFGEQPPNDWTDPNPVTFLTVKPKNRFLVAISPMDAGKAAAELAMKHLLDALEQWGIGAKSRAGYGRLSLINEKEKGQSADISKKTAPAPVALSETLEELRKAVDYVVDPPNRDQAPPIAQRLDESVTDALLERVTPEERPQARQILGDLLKHSGLKKRRHQRLDEIIKKVAE